MSETSSTYPEHDCQENIHWHYHIQRPYVYETCGICRKIVEIKQAPELDAIKEKLRLAEEALEVMKGEHISLCKYHRCSTHVEVSQLNTKEFSGAECGACVLEDANKKDENGIPMHLRMDMENTRKMLARQMARIDKLTQETFGYKKQISELSKVAFDIEKYLCLLPIYDAHLKECLNEELKEKQIGGLTESVFRSIDNFREALLKLRGEK